jgi:5-methylcytosine-specific restriction endonuclease McrA
MINCKTCGIELTEENTFKRGGRKTNFPIGYYRHCKKCYNANRLVRMVENKKKQVEFFGGKCKLCGYDKCHNALEFHHLDPTIKEESPSSLRQVTDELRWKSELEKCILLCSNCHREVHAGLHPDYLAL